MIRATFLALDEVVTNGVPALTGVQLTPHLGQFDKLAFQVVTSHQAGTAAGTITVRCQHSGDGHHFMDMAASAEIDAETVELGASSSEYGSCWLSLPFVRFIVSLGEALENAHVKLYVVAREPSG